MAKMYVIGDSQAGVLFIKTNPVRLAVVPMAEVLAYANAEPGDSEAIKQVLGNVAGAARKEDALSAIMNGGASVTDADFCFVADVEDAEWNSRRFRCPPVEQPLAIGDNP
jgi:hypothetical protein